MPWLVACLVFLATAPLGIGRFDTRLVAATTAGFAWLFLLGTSDKPLSPCQIAGGSPGAAANTFVKAVLSRDIAAASHDFEGGFGRDDRQLAASFASSHPNAQVVVSRRLSPGGKDSICSYWRDEAYVTACFRYPLRAEKLVLEGKTYRIPIAVAVGVGCDGYHWRVRRWS